MPGSLPLSLRLRILGKALGRRCGLLPPPRLPVPPGPLQLPGQRAGVRLFRDARAVPTIEARDSEDLFLALGYVTASERLFQMDLYRRVACGRLAEILGPGQGTPEARSLQLPGEVFLQMDLLHRALGLEAAAVAEAAAASVETRDALAAYASGVNAYFAEAEARRAWPIECALLGYTPEPWRPADSLAVGRLVAWRLTIALRAELVLGEIALLRKGPPLLPSPPAWSPTLTGPPPARLPAPGAALGEFRWSAGFVGSNAWVVSGARSASGKPVLATDPHLPLGLPGIWLPVCLRGGPYRVAGVAVPGVPGVAIGRTPSLAWGMTAALPDDVDLYRETLAPGPPVAARRADRWEPLEVEEVAVRVRGEADPRRVRLRFVRRFPGRCPLISDLLDAGPLGPLSLAWTGMVPTQSFDALLAMNRALDLAAFREALREFGLAPQNVLVADAAGNIGAFVAGRFPRRSRPGDGSLPLDGADPATSWQGFLDFEELPHVVNPASGLLVSANNRASEAGPYLTTLWEPAYRASRILGVLREMPVARTEACRRLQTDTVSLQALLLIGRCLAPHRDALEGEARAAADRLIIWDGRVSAESSQAALFHAWYWRLREKVLRAPLEALRPGLAARLFAVNHVSAALLDALLLDGEPTALPAPLPSLLQETLEEALEFLRERLGPDAAAWRWGRLHQLTVRHPLMPQTGWLGRILSGLFAFNRGPIEMPGDGMTVNMSAYLFSAPFEPLAGPSYRQVVDLGNPDEAGWVIPGGVSGDPASPYYADQLAAWLAGTLFPMPLP
ncbi:MAG TPA: penicillin acylase family protein [Candidatus Methylomirabilis sp.]|nr:penicillin acylase family protein [Candidatus Methylomirabilis sp.]